MTALSHPSVSRLTDTWNRVPSKEKKIFDNLVKYAPEQDGRELLHSIFQQIKVSCNKSLIIEIATFLRNQNFIKICSGFKHEHSYKISKESIRK